MKWSHKVYMKKDFKAWLTELLNFEDGNFNKDFLGQADEDLLILFSSWNFTSRTSKIK